PTLANPFQLSEAIRWAALYGVVLLAIAFARHRLGPWGLTAASVLAGLADVDAITLSLAALSRTELDPQIAARGIALAGLTNAARKAGYAAWRGGADSRRALLVILGAAFAAGAAAVPILGLKPWR